MPGLFLECDMWLLYYMKSRSLRGRFKVTTGHLSTTVPLRSCVFTGKLSFQNPETQRDTLTSPPNADGVTY